jgi:hypothetical protein
MGFAGKLYSFLLARFCIISLSKYTMTTQKNDSNSSSDIVDTNSSENIRNYAAVKPDDIISENNEEDKDATITKTELDLLDNAGAGMEQDDINEENAQVDNEDEDGDALNEGGDLTGGDLDVPGADLDDADEMIGEEDEENNSYSEADQGDR